MASQEAHSTGSSMAETNPLVRRSQRARKMLRRGVIVRPVANYGLAGFLRVSIGLPEQNARFLAALGEILERA